MFSSYIRESLLYMIIMIIIYDYHIGYYDSYTKHI